MPDIATIFTSGAILVHIASLLYAIGLWVRDQLLLRLMILVGTIFYIIYYYVIAETPLWDAMIRSLILGAVNLWVIIQILIERTTFRMSADEKRLYQAFNSMSPGEFRRLLKVVEWRRTKKATVLTKEDVDNPRLYFVLEGRAEVRKGKAKFELDQGSFIGELGYLLKTPATATVAVPKDALVAAWKHEDLEAIEKKHPSIRIAMREILNVDLAAKVKEGMRS